MESQLVGGGEKPLKQLPSLDKIIRPNPKSDNFKVKRFHHIEFWCGDATNASLRFSQGLGMPVVAKSDLSTGNHVHASYALCSGDIYFLFTAPYNNTPSFGFTNTSTAAIPTFDYECHASFVSSHGLGVRTVAMEVEDAEAAYDASVAAGALPSSPPVVLLEDDRHEHGYGHGLGHTILAEVQLFGDVVLRFVSFSSHARETNYFLPKFVSMHYFDHATMTRGEFGLKGLDHVGGTVPKLASVIEYVTNITGFHNFEKFATKDLVAGLNETGLETVFLANNNESVILNFSEPDSNTRKSPMETYLERNQGSGVQHLALITDDIFTTIRGMKKRSLFEYMPPPSKEYYQFLKQWVGDVLSDEEISECEELGLKVDRDHEGVIIQTFTTPVGDRLTIFIEVIQRIGCMIQGEDGKVSQKGGCGGFGRGNVSQLFKSMEDFDKTLENTPNLLPCLN